MSIILIYTKKGQYYQEENQFLFQSYCLWEGKISSSISEIEQKILCISFLGKLSPNLEIKKSMIICLF